MHKNNWLVQDVKCGDHWEDFNSIIEDGEEHIINRIISCVSEDIEVLKHKAVHKGELCFEGLYIDKRKRIVVRKK